MQGIQIAYQEVLLAAIDTVTISLQACVTYDVILIDNPFRKT